MTAVDRLRALAGHPRVVPATALLLRAAVVRGSVGFVARELTRRERLHLYRLRESGLRVGVRHGTGDVVTLGEVFHERDYRVPAAVAAAIGTPQRVLDLGANVGMFGLAALASWPDARVVAYEPDPANAEVHERIIAANGLGNRWTLVTAAAGARDGVVSFAAGGVALSHVAEGSDGDLDVAIRDVLDEVADADLVKLDVEGGEWEILGDERFARRPPAAIVLEYHPRGCPGPSPHDEVRRLLAAAGLVTEGIWSRADGHGMLWGWRPTSRAT